jgi:hypothetical protein
MILQNIGFCQNVYDPCLITGHIVDPTDPTDIPSLEPLTLGIYMNNFVYLPTNPTVQARFQPLLKKYVTVDFMGIVKWFLGTHFQWMVMPDEVKVNLSQPGFESHLIKDNKVHLRNITPDATPYRSGLPIDACPESNDNEDKASPMFVKRKCKYQNIISLIWWLAQSTSPDLAPSHSFLFAYCNKPSRSHLNAALYVPHYIPSTIDYGFTFISKDEVSLHTYMLFPHCSNTEAYEDTIPPYDSDHHRLTTYSDACWGSQIGNAIQEGIQLPLFKFCSMRRAIIFWSGSPITWKANQQD